MVIIIQSNTYPEQVGFNIIKYFISKCLLNAVFEHACVAAVSAAGVADVSAAGDAAVSAAGVAAVSAAGVAAVSAAKRRII